MHSQSPLRAALSDVDQFTLDVILYDRGLHPQFDTFNPNTGSFVAFNDRCSFGAAFWVSAGQLYSPQTPITGSAIDDIMDAIQANTAPLIPIGLIDV